MSVHYQALQNICMYSQSIIFLTADSRVSVRNILKEREREGTNNPPPPPRLQTGFFCSAGCSDSSLLCAVQDPCQRRFSERHGPKQLRCSCGTVCQESWLSS